MAWKDAALTFYCFQIEVSWNSALTTPLSLHYIYIIKLYNYAASFILSQAAHTFATTLTNVRNTNNHIIQF